MDLGAQGKSRRAGRHDFPAKPACRVSTERLCWPLAPSGYKIAYVCRAANVWFKLQQERDPRTPAGPLSRVYTEGFQFYLMVTIRKRPNGFGVFVSSNNAEKRLMHAIRCHLSLFYCSLVSNNRATQAQNCVDQEKLPGLPASLLGTPDPQGCPVEVMGGLNVRRQQLEVPTRSEPHFSV